jgi:hypothetical protein
MALDLGLNTYIGSTSQSSPDLAAFQQAVAALITAANQPYGNVAGWSDARALALSEALGQLQNGLFDR